MSVPGRAAAQTDGAEGGRQRVVPLLEGRTCRAIAAGRDDACRSVYPCRLLQLKGVEDSQPPVALTAERFGERHGCAAGEKLLLALRHGLFVRR